MAKPKKGRVWLFKKPVGDSEIIQRGNLMRRTTSDFTCGFCGTYHKELHETNDGYTIFRLLGREGVMECCGKLVDIVYSEWKNEFVDYLLEEEFSTAPLDGKFYILRKTLLGAIKKWKVKAEEAGKEEAEAAESAASLIS